MSSIRLRQVALVARDLEPAAAELAAVFGLQIAFRDPSVAAWGLVNVVMPVGGEFLEIVQPVEADASAARYLDRRGGDAGYMVLLQTEDALARRERLIGMGVRPIARKADQDYVYTHFHPADCAGVLTSIDTVPGDAGWREPQSDWPPGGPAWRAFPATAALGIAAVDVQNRDPKAAAARWSALLETPIRGGTELVFERGRARFVAPRDADGTGVIGLDIVVTDPAANLAAARGLGLLVADGAVRICGTWMRPIAA